MHKNSARNYSNLLLGISIAFVLVLVLSSVSVFADGEGSPTGGGGVSTGGGGGGGGTCTYHEVYFILSNTSANITAIEPWSPNSTMLSVGGLLGYKIFVKNNDAHISIDSKIKATVLINGWPYTWESEVKSIGPKETASFVNSLNWKFGNRTYPIIIVLSYGDKTSYKEVYCNDKKILKDWFAFNQTIKGNLTLPEEMSETELQKSWLENSTKTEMEQPQSENITTAQKPAESGNQAPTAAIILQKPEKRETGFFAAIKSFFAKIFRGGK